MQAAPAVDFERSEHAYAGENIRRIQTLVESGRERDDATRFESTTQKFVEVARRCHVFVDAGAEFGYYARLALREMPEPRELHLLEPDPPRYRALADAIGAHAEVTVHDLALSDRAGQLNLYKPASGTSATLDAAVSEHACLSAQYCYQVRCARLDDLLPERRIDLVKMDIEGAELLALGGMHRVLREDRPRIFMEKHRRYIEAIDPDGIGKMVRTLEDHDYRAYACDGGRCQLARGYIPGRAYLCPRELEP